MSICFSCRKRGRLLSTRAYSAQSLKTEVRDYKSAVIALNGLQSNFSIVEAIRKMGPNSNKSALPEMIAWLRRIGYQPSDLDVLNPIHVAGTKGKGSTSSFISSILAQYLPSKKSIHAERIPSSVGLYTSPHLRFVRERIKVNDEPIPEKTFARFFWEVWDRLEATSSRTVDGEGRAVAGKPVYFHYLTLMALHCYIQSKVGTAVIECGIGGEYDTTNILVSPSVTAVTSLGIDHEALLGDTIDQIAWHKAGIFKPGVPAFSVLQPETAMAVLRERADERQAPLHFIPRHDALDEITLGLQGHFQETNASLAIAVSASHLQRLGFTGMPDPLNPKASLPHEFKTGLELARLGGRCDHRVDTHSSDLDWYIDGGHTMESIEVAGKWFAARTHKMQRSKPVRILVFNQQTRNAAALAARLHETLVTATGDPQPFSHAIFCPNTTYRDAGYKADLVSINTSQSDVDTLRVQKELAQAWQSIDVQTNVHVLSTIEDAILKAREIAGSQRAEVLITGSLHLVGGCIEVLEAEVEDSK